MGIKLSSPADISEPAPQPALRITEVTDQVVLQNRFTEALRYAKDPTAATTTPDAFVWAGTLPGDIKGLMARFNEHPEVKGKTRVSALYNGDVVLTDLSAPRPTFTEGQERAIVEIQRLPARALADVSAAYSVARASGRLSTWPALKTAWDAALARGDPPGAATCAFGARVMDAMKERFFPTAPPAPPKARPVPVAAAPGVLEEHYNVRLFKPHEDPATNDIVQGVRHRRFPILKNADAADFKTELDDARRQNFRPVPPSDLTRLRTLAADGDEVKWVLRADGQLRFGPMTVTHPVVAEGKEVVAAGQAYLYETPDRRLAVLRLTNFSGHYQPPKSVLTVAAPFFEMNGISAPANTHRGHDQ